jgi:putative glutamine amidotransferase
MVSSTSRPVIGVPTQNLQSIGGVSPDIPPSWVMSHRYVDSITALGATPWLIPLVDDATLRSIYEHLDGIFLPGGADVDPASYNAARDSACDRSDPPRDRVEVALVRWAMADEKPVLGVCRGLQIINLAAGGTLVQDLATGRAGSIKHDYFPYRDGHSRDYLAHTVRVVEGTRLHRIVGETQLPVNSMHHQGIDRLGQALVVSAVAPDGVVEGLEGTSDAFLLGVQWHPEVLTDSDPRMRQLFEEFIDAAREHAVRTVVGAPVGPR